MKRFALAAFLSSLIAGCAAGGLPRSPETSVVLYIPFSVTTYTAVTVDNLASESPCALTDSSGQLDWLSTIAMPVSSPTFDQKNVRARIILSGTSFFVDSSAVLLTEHGAVALSGTQRSILIDILETMRRTSDCSRYDWLDD